MTLIVDAHVRVAKFRIGGKLKSLNSIIQYPIVEPNYIFLQAHFSSVAGSHEKLWCWCWI